MSGCWLKVFQGLEVAHDTGCIIFCIKLPLSVVVSLKSISRQDVYRLQRYRSTTEQDTLSFYSSLGTKDLVKWHNKQRSANCRLMRVRGWEADETTRGFCAYLCQTSTDLNINSSIRKH
eukprot:scaffold71359_cov15-Prasinocladus_malaysianus.AAC.1